MCAYKLEIFYAISAIFLIINKFNKYNILVRIYLKSFYEMALPHFSPFFPKVQSPISTLYFSLAKNLCTNLTLGFYKDSFNCNHV